MSVHFKCDGCGKDLPLGEPRVQFHVLRFEPGTFGPTSWFSIEACSSVCAGLAVRDKLDEAAKKATT